MKETRYFEWIDGEDAGEVCILSHVENENGETYLHFTNGDVCNVEYVSPMTTNRLDVKGKFMVEIMGPSYAWKIENVAPKIFVDHESKESVEVPPLNEVLGTRKNDKPKFIPPQIKLTSIPSLPTVEEWGKQKNIIIPPIVEREVVKEVEPERLENVVPVAPPVETKVEQKQTPHTFDPVNILVSTCKKHETDVDLTLTINLPSKAMYVIANSEFEDGGDKFIDFVVRDIDTKMIIESIKASLKQYYSENA